MERGTASLEAAFDLTTKQKSFYFTIGKQQVYNKNNNNLLIWEM